MIESAVERKLVDGIKALGGVAFKFVSPGNTGVPDRIIILPGGAIYFVELKTDVGRLSKVQIMQIERLEKLGARVAVLYGADSVATFLKLLREAQR